MDWAEFLCATGTCSGTQERFVLHPCNLLAFPDDLLMRYDGKHLRIFCPSIEQEEKINILAQQYHFTWQSTNDPVYLCIPWSSYQCFVQNIDTLDARDGVCLELKARACDVLNATYKELIYLSNTVVCIVNPSTCESEKICRLAHDYSFIWKPVCEIPECLNFKPLDFGYEDICTKCLVKKVSFFGIGCFGVRCKEHDREYLADPSVTFQQTTVWMGIKKWFLQESDLCMLNKIYESCCDVVIHESFLNSVYTCHYNFYKDMPASSEVFWEKVMMRYKVPFMKGPIIKDLSSYCHS